MKISSVKAMERACDEGQWGEMGEEVVRNLLRWDP